jgi:hypothetical protein
MMLRDTGVRSDLSESEGLRNVLAAERKRTAKRALAERRVACPVASLGSTPVGVPRDSKTAQVNSSAVLDQNLSCQWTQ